MNYPEPVVRAFILNNQGELFIMGSFNENGYIAVPGGHIEMGENIIEALEREVREETGLEISDIKFLSVDEYINKEKSKHFVFLNYLAKSADSDNVVLCDEDATEFKWIKPRDVINLQLTESLRGIIEKFLI